MVSMRKLASAAALAMLIPAGAALAEGINYDRVRSDAVKFLKERAKERHITRSGDVIGVTTTLPDGRSFSFDLNAAWYFDEVNRGFLNGQTAEERQIATTNLRTRTLDDLAARLSSGDQTLHGRIQTASNVIDFLGENTSYEFDQDQGFFRRFIFSETSTPYTISAKEVVKDYLKSTFQFLVDGGGDCDDYSLAAADLLNRAGVNTMIVNIDTPGTFFGGEVSRHQVIGIQVSKQEYDALYNGAARESYVHSLWQEVESKFDDASIWTFSDATLHDTEVIEGVASDGKRRYIMLLEPQGVGRWAGHKREKGATIDSVTYPRNGATLRHIGGFYVGETFPAVEIHESGRVNAFTNRSKTRGYFYQCASRGCVRER